MKFKILKSLLKQGFDKASIRRKILRGVDFRDVDFRDVDFRGVDFRGANFRGADFRDVDFRGVNFQGANFQGANFRGANFQGADFQGVNFGDVDFRGVNFRGANFQGVDFQGVDFRGANLKDILINENTLGLTINCPEEGAFIGYKLCQGLIVKLQILENALRSSATSYKCRCSEALVLEIEKGLTEIQSDWNPNFIYKVGETVKVDNFDKNRWNECSTGIHFFMSKEMARQY